MSIQVNTASRQIQFENGIAIGTSDKWLESQYCKILTPAGIIGCAIFNLDIAEEVGSAMAIAKGAPDNQLVEPEQLLDARIVGVSSKASSLGVYVGMTGRQAVERFLEVSGGVQVKNGAVTKEEAIPSSLTVRALHHVTLVVEDLLRSAKFYRDVLGMKRVFRPDFGFAGMFFEAANTQIHLIPVMEWHSNKAKRFEAEGPDACHFAFEVDDVALARKILERHNVEILRGPKQNSAGSDSNVAPGSGRVCVRTA